MLVLFAVIVVNVRGHHAFAHGVKTYFDALFDMRVAGVEAKPQIMQVRIGNEVLQRSRCAQLIGRISSAIVTPRAFAKIESCSSELKAASSLRGSALWRPCPIC